MKVDISIKGVSIEEAQVIIAKLSGTSANIEVEKPTQPNNLPPLVPVANTVQPANNAPAANTAGGAEVDADGLPWDKRIHSSNHKKNADGRWTVRRNVADDAFAAVVAELRAGQGYNGGAPAQHVHTPPPVPAQPFVPPVVQPVHYNPGTPGAIVGGMPIPPGGVPPFVPPQPTFTPPPAPAAQDINALFGKIQSMFQNGTADALYVTGLQNRLSQQFQVQIGSINDIAGRPDIIGHAFALIQADGK